MGKCNRQSAEWRRQSVAGPRTCDVQCLVAWGEQAAGARNTTGQRALPRASRIRSYSVVGMLSQVTWRAKVSRSERISQHRARRERPRARHSPAPCWHSSLHHRTRGRPRGAPPTTGEVSNLATFTRSRKRQEDWRQGTHEGRAHPATLACMPAQVRKLAETCREEPGVGQGKTARDVRQACVAA